MSENLSKMMINTMSLVKEKGGSTSDTLDFTLFFF